MTPQDILETEVPDALKAKPELSQSMNAIIHFIITGEQGGTWTLDCTVTPAVVKRGAEGTPKMTVTSGAEDFVQISQNQLDPQTALMKGKLKVKPMDVSLALKLFKLLG